MTDFSTPKGILRVVSLSSWYRDMAMSAETVFQHPEGHSPRCLEDAGDEASCRVDTANAFQHPEGHSPRCLRSTERRSGPQRSAHFSTPKGILRVVSNVTTETASRWHDDHFSTPKGILRVVSLIRLIDSHMRMPAPDFSTPKGILRVVSTMHGTQHDGDEIVTRHFSTPKGILRVVSISTQS